MRKLFIYDTKGTIFSSASGDVLEPVGIPFLWVDVPDNKRVVTIDVTTTPNVPIFEDLPKTQTELMQAQIDSLTLALAEMMGV